MVIFTCGATTKAALPYLRTVVLDREGRNGSSLGTNAFVARDTIVCRVHARIRVWFQ